jgi:hypothetical protein
MLRYGPADIMINSVLISMMQTIGNKLRLLLSIVILICGFIMKADSTKTIPFPEVKGKNLQGNEVLFPKAFKSHGYHVVMIAFEQDQQPDVNTWLSHLDKLADSRKDFDYFELPTISRMNALMRWIIYRGMRSGIKEEVARKRTVTLHIDKEPFKEALNIRSESDICAFLVDSEGKVIWQKKGIWSENSWKELLATLPSEI